MRSVRDINLEILQNRIELLDRINTPRVGDFVVHPSGKVDRITELWDGSHLQTGGGSESFYLGDGFVEYSGSLDSGYPASRFVLTPEIRKGKIWFFSENIARAYNGVNYEIDFRVYKII